ncbi:hypothetical protein LTR50_004307 [Elasticomyces elasticus]|nr:hypothetical protein LTR50_004307 [Elasticomyces elasticus]
MYSALRAGRLYDSTDTSAPRQRLRGIVENGNNVRALTLQGLIYRAHGDDRRALAMFEKGTTRLARQHGDDRAKPDSNPQDRLSAPYLELARLRVELGEDEKAREALKQGFKADDPDAHYQYAVLEYSLVQTHTPEWLYHMTKAASSGHARAEHQVGLYYAEKDPLYSTITKSPLNTAHDRKEQAPATTPYETATATTSSLLSVLTSVLRTLFPSGKISSTDPSSPQNMQAFARFPPTPAYCRTLSIHWLTLASNTFYLPATLALARHSLVTTNYVSASVLLKHVFEMCHMRKEQDLEAELADLDSVKPRPGYGESDKWDPVALRGDAEALCEEWKIDIASRDGKMWYQCKDGRGVVFEATGDMV